jgi:gentisate 1,2-dioxygenase
VSKTLGGSAERLYPGGSSPYRRETTSFVYHVIEGSGYTDVNGERIEWVNGDTFCIPSWHRFQHVADQDSNAYLYRFDDQPMLKSLGFYRTEEMDVEGLVS